MAITSSMPLEHAAKAIEQNIHGVIVAEIERVIHKHIDPVIKEMAELKAREMCEDVRVHMERSMADPLGGMIVVVKFGGGK